MNITNDEKRILKRMSNIFLSSDEIALDDCEEALWTIEGILRRDRIDKFNNFRFFDDMMDDYADDIETYRPNRRREALYV